RVDRPGPVRGRIVASVSGRVPAGCRTGRAGGRAGRVAAGRVAGVVGLGLAGRLVFELGPLVGGDVVLVVGVLAVELPGLLVREALYAALLVGLGGLLELAERAADVAVPPHALRVAHHVPARVGVVERAVADVRVRIGRRVVTGVGRQECVLRRV